MQVHVLFFLDLLSTVKTAKMNTLTVPVNLLYCPCRKSWDFLWHFQYFVYISCVYTSQYITIWIAVFYAVFTMRITEVKPCKKFLNNFTIRWHFFYKSVKWSTTKQYAGKSCSATKLQNRVPALILGIYGMLWHW